MNLSAGQLGLFESSPLRSDDSRNSQVEAGPQKRWLKGLNTKLTQGGPSVSSSVRSDGSCDGMVGG
jgi:hypothetical protein